MAKKKKPAAKLARGYGAAAPSASSSKALQGALTSSISSSATSSSTAAQITATAHQTLEDLLALLLVLDENDKAQQLSAVQPARLLVRMGQLHDSLIGYGFTWDQIVSLVTAIGSSALTLETALDWLCLHLPTPDLPPLFTDGSVRNAIRNSSSAASTNLTVISAAAGTNNNNEQSPRFFSDLPTRVPEEAPPEVEEDDDKAAQKAWLLAQYQYDDDYDDDDYELREDGDAGVVSEPTTTMKADNCEPQESSSALNVDALEEKKGELQESTTTMNADDCEPQKSSEEMRLLEMQNQEREFEAYDLKEESELIADLVDATVAFEPTNTTNGAKEPRTISTSTTEEAREFEVDVLEEGSELVVEDGSDATTAILDPNNTTHTIANEPAPLSPDELRLAEMRCEFKELEADAANDASNYMRSKQDNKELQKQIKKLRTQVTGLERKILRQAAAARKAEKEAMLEETAAISGSGSSSNVDKPNYKEQEDGIFSMFDEEEATTTTEQESKTTKSEEALTGVYIPEGSVPDNWTGSTPKLYLEDWCRKEKAPKAIFQKLAMNGCRLRVALGKNKSAPVVVAEEKGPVDTYKDAQQYVALKALYQISPTLPLYRLFPPFYRDLWLSWTDAERKDKQDQGAALADQRRETIEKLIRCIPTTSLPLDVAASDTRRASSFHSEEETPLVLESWDDHEAVIETTTVALESWDDRKAGIEKTAVANDYDSKATSLGRRLKEKFLRRQESSKYQSMQQVRRKLPIHAFREEILETIRKNPVTILWAETGMYLLHLWATAFVPLVRRGGTSLLTLTLSACSR
jgi:hypothetical protein